MQTGPCAPAARHHPCLQGTAEQPRCGPSGGMNAGRESPALFMLKDFALHTAALAAWAGCRSVLKAHVDQLAGFTSTPELVVLADLACASKGSGG